MQVSRRTAIILFGGVLIALGLSSFVSTLLTHASGLDSNVGGAAVFIVPGAILLFFGLQPGPKKAVPAAPSRFWTIVALVTGCLLSLYALATGVAISLGLGVTEGLLQALLPWGVAGIALLSYGIARWVAQADQGRAAVAAHAILESITLPPGAQVQSAGLRPIDKAGLMRMEREILHTVQQAYSATVPALREALYVWLLAWIAAVAWVLTLAVTGFGVGLPVIGLAAHTAPLAVAIVAIAFASLGIAELGLGVPARLHELAKAEAELEAGRLPEDWESKWWFPFIRVGRLIRTNLGRVPSRSMPPTEPSVLETSYSFLQFGRSLAIYARYWYTSIFLTICMGGAITSILAGTLISLLALGGPVGAGAGWGAAFVVMAGSFAYLYGRYRTLDPIADRLAVLQEVEAELSRAFWARF